MPATFSKYSHLTDDELLRIVPTVTPLEAELASRLSDELTERDTLLEDVCNASDNPCEDYCEVVDELTRANELSNAAMVIFTKACDPEFKKSFDPFDTDFEGVRDSIDKVVNELSTSTDPEEVENVIAKMFVPSETPEKTG